MLKKRLFLLTGITILLGFSLEATAGETRLCTTGDQGHEACLLLDQAPVVTMQSTRLELQISTDSSPQTATCDLTMPAMPMPPNRPILHPVNDILRGEAIFTMAGSWQANCAVSYTDGVRENFLFNLERVLLK